MNLKSLEETLAARRLKHSQATRHQDEAIKTGEMLNDLKGMGIYLSIFNKHKDRIEDLKKCRSWVLRIAKGDKGRMFVKCYKKFLT